jgi:hypothetical protein
MSCIAPRVGIAIDRVIAILKSDNPDSALSLRGKGAVISILGGEIVGLEVINNVGIEQIAFRVVRLKQFGLTTQFIDKAFNYKRLINILKATFRLLLYPLLEIN